jgi:hypothetical protein
MNTGIKRSWVEKYMQIINKKKFEDNEGVIRRQKSKKVRQYNSLKKKDNQWFTK